MFQTRRTGERSGKIKPFNVSIDYSKNIEPDPVVVCDHMVTEINVAVKYRVPSGSSREALWEVEKVSKRAIVHELYGPVLSKLAELKRAVYYDDKELTLQVIREAEGWIHDLEKN